jgi:hypothetical protein
MKYNASARWLACLTLLATQACGGGGGTDDIVEPPPAAGGFTIAAAPTINVIQGGSGQAQVTITRTGTFVDAVSFNVTGAPSGVSATVAPSPLAGGTATLDITTSAAVPVGNIALTITATATGQTSRTATTTLAVATNTNGTGNVVVDFSTCPVGNRAFWFAYQDGSGPWTQIVSDNGIYRFNVASQKGAYAFAALDGDTVINVSHESQSELTNDRVLPCGLPSSGLKTISGTVAGLGSGDGVFLGMGGNPNDHGPITTAFSLRDVPDGPQDFIAYRSSFTAPGTRELVIIRRDQNLANNASIGVIDFASAEAFAPATAPVTVTGANGAPLSHYMSYYAGNRCSYYDMYGDDVTPVNFTMRGIPAAQQRSTDFHQLSIYTQSSTFATQIFESFHTLSARTVAFAETIAAPTMSSLAGGHKRLQAVMTLPAEYDRILLISDPLAQQKGGSLFVGMSRAWIGSSSVVIVAPDFGSVTGWKSAFLPPVDATTDWTLFADGANAAGKAGSCVEGARFVSSVRVGRN